MRKISGLQEVRLAENPWGKAPKARGSRAQGLRFERSVGVSLPRAKHHQWLRFVDNGGVGYCCPDYLMISRGTLWVVECKLTDWDEAEAQMQNLYVPVLRALWDGEISSVTVAKHLSPHTRRDAVVTTWDAALSATRPVLHAFGKLQAPRTQLTAPKLREYWSIFEPMELAS